MHEVFGSQCAWEVRINSTTVQGVMNDGAKLWQLEQTQQVKIDRATSALFDVNQQILLEVSNSIPITFPNVDVP